MQYIEFGKDKDKVSEIVMGLMRISEMSIGEVYTDYLSGYLDSACGYNIHFHLP